MHAAFIGDDDRALPQIELLHRFHIAVAAATGLGNMRPIHRRGGIAIVQQVVVVAVAVLAGGRLLHALVDRLAVIALEVNVRLDPVALAATDRLGLEIVRMRHVGDVRVATRAQVLGVDRCVELLLVHKQRDRLAGGVGLDRATCRSGTQNSRSCRSPRRSERSRAVPRPASSRARPNGSASSWLFSDVGGLCHGWGRRAGPPGFARVQPRCHRIHDQRQ